jgi:hypothetical protein
MSRYYQKIEIDHLDIIKIKCLEYIKTQRDIYYQKPLGAYRNLNFNELITSCPELLIAFDRYNIKCIYAAVFVVYTNAGVFVHADAGTDQARINIPLENCQNTFTEFYEGGKTLSYTNPITGTNATRIIGAKLVDKVEIDQATVIRVKAAHSVHLDENHAPRVTLTLGFDRDPVFLLDN